MALAASSGYSTQPSAGLRATPTRSSPVSLTASSCLFGVPRSRTRVFTCGEYARPRMRVSQYIDRPGERSKFHRHSDCVRTNAHEGPIRRTNARYVCSAGSLLSSPPDPSQLSVMRLRTAQRQQHEPRGRQPTANHAFRFRLRLGLAGEEETSRRPMRARA